MSMSKLMTWSLGAAVLLVAGQTAAVAQGIPPVIQQQIRQYTGGGGQQGYQQKNHGYQQNNPGYQQNNQGYQQNNQGYGNNQQAGNQRMSRKQRARQTQLQQIMKSTPPQNQQYLPSAMGGAGGGGGMGMQ